MPPMKLVGSVSEPRLVGATRPPAQHSPSRCALCSTAFFAISRSGIVAAVQVDLGVRSGEAHRVADDLRVVVTEHTLRRLEDSGVRALCGRVAEDDEVARGDGRRRTGDPTDSTNDVSGRRPRSTRHAELLARLTDEDDISRAEVAPFARRHRDGRRHVRERARRLRGTREVLVLQPVDLDLLGRPGLEACSGSS